MGFGGEPGLYDHTDRSKFLGHLDQVFTGNRIIDRYRGDSGSSVGPGVTEDGSALLGTKIRRPLELGIIAEDSEPVGYALLIDPFIDLIGQRVLRGCGVLPGLRCRRRGRSSGTLSGL